MKLRGMLAATAATALLLTAGCGSADKVAGSDDHTTSQDQSGAKTHTVALSSDNFIDTVTKAQIAAKTSHIEMKINAAGQEISANGDVAIGDTAAATKMAMKMSMGAMGDMDIRYLDQVFYMNMGTVTGNKFAKLDLKDPSNPLSKSFGGLTDQLDPSKSLQMMDGAIKSVDKAGSPVEMDGVKAQPYKVVVDTAKMKESLGSLAGSAGASLPDELAYTYWVGTDNLPRKLTADVSGTSVESTFSKWGDDVSIKAPDASQISKTNPFANMPSSLPTS